MALSIMENRKHIRVPIEDVTVEVYSSQGEPSHIEICSIINLSRSGMLFESSVSYRENGRLRLTFMLPDCMVIFRTDALVIHKYRIASLYYTGVQFQRLSVVEGNTIDKFVEKRKNN